MESTSFACIGSTKLGGRAGAMTIWPLRKQKKCGYCDPTSNPPVDKRSHKAAAHHAGVNFGRFDTVSKGKRAKSKKASLTAKTLPL
jgi:hypothetical protein